MARTAIPIIPVVYNDDISLQTNANAVAVDDMNGMYLLNSPNQYIVFYVINSSAMTSVNVTVTSVPDPNGRGGTACDNITNQAVAVGEVRQFGPFNPNLWNQPNGWVHVDFSTTDAAIKILGVQIA